MADQFLKSTWVSERTRSQTTMVRWGHAGQPVLVFPTAGGDAEEIERMKLVYALWPLIEAGRVMIYSCDSVAGQAWFGKQGSPELRMRLQHEFHQYVKHEVAPAIRRDCKDPGATIWTSGASIGAFHAVATVCRFPDIFTRALGMSGTYDLMRFIEVKNFTEDYFVSSPLQFVPTLNGPHLDVLRRCLVVLASGEGRAENMGESWAMAKVLGNKRIPNRVDPWGPNYNHDWPTWRAMLPKYLAEWTS
ncbi:MAG: hypothetical protein EXR75_10010 [Myxococcales bacterium]|nr:hypothetical protein [Myxococcales bacterium]